uniref:Uncharacterized protein n=1 Tax=Rangifer tarandus platyrhynchus TaxID=3082113 RepID=A0ACB0E722_RANTA|nr:unnamed protein product [Rangifer tarandus platyrhynchus]
MGGGAGARGWAPGQGWEDVPTPQGTGTACVSLQVTQMPAVREMDAETPCGVVRPPLQEGPPGASGGEQGQPEHLAKHVEERQVCSVHLPSLPVTRGPSPPFPQAPPRASWGPGGIPEVVLPLSRCECYSLCLLPPLGPPALLLGLHFPLGPACSTPTVSLLVAEGRALLTTGLASATAQTLPLPGRSSPDPPQRGACPPAPTPPRNPINLCETSYRSAVWTHWKRLTSKYFILPFCTLAGSPERGHARLCPSSQDMLQPATFLGAAGGALGWLAAWETGQESLLGPWGLDGAAVGSVPKLGEVWGSWPKRGEGPERLPLPDTDPVILPLKHHSRDSTHARPVSSGGDHQPLHEPQEDTEDFKTTVGEEMVQVQATTPLLNRFNCGKRHIKSTPLTISKCAVLQPLSPRRVTLNVAKHTPVSLATFPLPRSAPPLPSPPPSSVRWTFYPTAPLLRQAACLSPEPKHKLPPHQWPWQSRLAVYTGRSFSTWLPQEMAFPSFPCSQGQPGLQLARVRADSRVREARVAGEEADPDDRMEKSSSFSPGF